jgi:16S rRNA (uracil1498-N3)-methyltransferase
MRLTRVFVDAPLESGGTVDLPVEPARILVKVLRARSGDEVHALQRRRARFLGIIGSVRGKHVSAQIGAAHPVETESRLAITLVQCMPRGEKMDWVVQKATELGVTRIVPVISQRSVVRLDDNQAQSKQSHWQAVAVSACEQCGRARLPTVERPVQLLNYLGGLSPATHPRWVLEPHTAATKFERLYVFPAADMAIGPEGRLRADELEAFTRGIFTAGTGPTRAAHGNSRDCGTRMATNAFWGHVMNTKLTLAAAACIAVLAGCGGGSPTELDDSHDADHHATTTPPPRHRRRHRPPPATVRAPT